jgi:hypothetical protein
MAESSTNLAGAAEEAEGAPWAALCGHEGVLHKLETQEAKQKASMELADMLKDPLLLPLQLWTTRNGRPTHGEIPDASIAAPYQQDAIKSCVDIAARVVARLYRTIQMVTS